MWASMYGPRLSVNWLLGKKKVAASRKPDVPGYGEASMADFLRAETSR